MTSRRTKVRDILQAPALHAEATVKGWVRTRRDSKGVVFVALNDGSTIHSLQAVIIAAQVSPAVLEQIATGACISLSGPIVPSPGKGQQVEIQARAVTVYGPADSAAYPLQKKGHTLEFLRDIAHLRPRTNTFGAILRLRHALAFAIHKYFNDRGFCYLHTPIITGSDCEGAGKMFRVTALDLENLPRLAGGAIDYSHDFFGGETKLTVSGQLEGELGALALAEIYTFGPTFRAENSNTPRHLAEFWMVEPEMAFYDLEDTLDLAEDFITSMVRAALEACPDDIAFLARMYDPELLPRLEAIGRERFVRLPYTEAISSLELSGRAFEFPIRWGLDLQAGHERFVVEEHCARPVMLVDYPRQIKPLYMKQNDDGRTVRAMDVLFPRIGEIIGGSQREDSHALLQQRIAEAGIPEKDIWWYLETRKFGSAPHSGFGLGFERLMLFVSGMGNIRDVIPFPRTPKNARF